MAGCGGGCGVRTQQKSWPVCGALPRPVPQWGAQLQGTLRAREQPQPPSPSWAAVPGLGATRSHAGSPGAVRDQRTRAAALPPLAPAGGTRGAPGLGGAGGGAAACGAAETMPQETRPPAPGEGPRGSPSPARRSRRSRGAPLQQRHTNFPRKTLGPGGLGRSPRLNGTLPRCRAGRSPGGAGRERVCSGGWPAAAVPAQPESLRGELHVPASERP